MCLVQIWLPDYFLTGDGPCHVYNGQVLHDLWTGRNTALFSRFFEISYQPNPNWLTTVVIAGLLFFVKGVVAEKIFLSLYVLIFTSGFYLLLRKLNQKDNYWLLIIFVFVFTHALSKGFYNFSFSIAFFFWAVWAWLSFLDHKNRKHGMVFFLAVGLGFFTHLLAFVFTAFTCGALMLSYALAAHKNNGLKKTVVGLLHNALYLLLFLLPFLIIMHWFTEKQGGMQLQLSHHFKRIDDLVIFSYIVNVSDKEAVWGRVAGITLSTLTVLSLLRFMKGFQWNKYDGLLMSLLFVLFVYFYFPEDFLGRAILITLRVQLYVFILAACCITYMVPFDRFKNLGGVIVFICFGGLSFFQLVCRMNAAAAEADLLSVKKLINANSVVLPLNFSPNGKDAAGQLISDRNWIFCHATQYPDADRPLIILDNYEANMGYFPLRWKDNTNPYNLLSTGSGIEGLPPCADIDAYKAASGVTIDYIVMWCFDSSALQNVPFKKFYESIYAGYDKIYTSDSKRSVLFERKPTSIR
jgi:hypothetical protein